MIASGQVPQVWTQATPEQVPQIVQQVEAKKVTPAVTTETPPATPETPKAPTQTTPPPKTEKKQKLLHQSDQQQYEICSIISSIELMLPLNKKHCHLIK